MNKAQETLMIELIGEETFKRDMQDYPYSLPDKARVYDDSRDLISDVSSSGSHFFCRDTTKAFGAKLYGMAGQRFLVMSDAAPSGRLYRVAYVYATPGTERLSVERLGGFTGRRGLDKAAKLAQTLALTFKLCQTGSATDTPCHNVITLDSRHMCGDCWHATGPIGD